MKVIKGIILCLMLLVPGIAKADSVALQTYDGNAVSASNPLPIHLVGGGGGSSLTTTVTGDFTVTGVINAGAVQTTGAGESINGYTHTDNIIYFGTNAHGVEIDPNVYTTGAYYGDGSHLTGISVSGSGREVGVDGTTYAKNSTGIQAAIDSLMTPDANGIIGGKVKLTGGYFARTAMIKLKPNVWLQGAGVGNTIIAAQAGLDPNSVSGDQMVIKTFASNGSACSYSSNNCYNVKLSDLTIDGGTTLNPGWDAASSPSKNNNSSPKGVDIRNLRYGSINNIEIRNTFMDGMSIISASSVDIANNYIHHVGISSNASTRNGISLYGTQASNNTIKGNKITDVGDECITLSESSEVSVIGNDLSHCDIGVEITSQWDFGDLYGVVVSGNVMHDMTGLLGVSTMTGIDWSPVGGERTYGNVISNNTFNNIQDNAMYLSKFNNGVISDNAIYGALMSHTDNVNYIIDLLQSNGNQITGNKISFANNSDSGNGGIRFYGSSDNNVVDNSIYSAPAVGVYLMKLAIGAWVTSHSYNVGDSVSVGTAIYDCKVAHTSGTFATDLAAGDWVLMTATMNATNNYFGNNYLNFGNPGGWTQGTAGFRIKSDSPLNTGNLFFQNTVVGLATPANYYSDLGPSTTNNYMAFGTAYTGNIGIGTGAPSRLLEVNGNMLVDQTLYTMNMVVTNAVTINTSGSTGIGTTAPVAKLQVGGGAPAVSVGLNTTTDMLVIGRLEVDSNLYNAAIKATSGSVTVCVDTVGRFVKSATACTGGY